MDCYLINLSTGIVENTIVADPAIDLAPEGYKLVPMPVIESSVVEQPSQISAVI
jgi:hypothetical protein